ncbi:MULTISPECIES: FAD-dependent oxidoreductase [Pseudoalteromonas]|uniref:D-amino-acid oxidase n=1 Tax=Pseudoalteromonas amylolytica TaxID=1859457 RepID=A0A1S1MRJ5_9GAMM|nr:MULTISPECIES: FAD-dependent oxidoreductase [Pseudoalteromonas]OHU86143.1 thiamine biosynthesis protein [Pseudoalteromonas sp. JW3]OHU89750.1 thiamine biosynthesis protein [Pseudoalteromonas amylolytica]
MKEYRVAILGFGLVGKVAAMMLHKHHQLSIFEAACDASQNGAGALAAAMLAPMAESVNCEVDIAELGLEAMAMWPELLAQLPTNVMFQQAGTLVIAHNQDMGDLQSFMQRLKPIRGHHAQRVLGADIAKLEPDLAGRFHQGVYLPSEGQLDNLAFYQQSYAFLRQQGVQFHFSQNVELHPQSHKSGIEMVNGEAFDWIIDCRGIGAKEQCDGLRGVRGEVARIYAPEVQLQRPVRLMHPRYPIYIAPKPNNEFVIGATEIESQDSGPATVRSTLELLSAAYTVHSGFAEGRVMAINAGLRPAFGDNRPRSSIKGNVISINGLYRHGYLLAPAVVRQALTKELL